MSLEHVNGATRKELLSLPEKDWQTTLSYDSLLILNDGKKHESGWGLITVIGCFDMKPYEIACSCADDIHWIGMEEGVRMDCAMPSRAMHFWSRRKGAFTVGKSLSSTTIWFGAE